MVFLVSQTPNMVDEGDHRCLIVVSEVSTLLEVLLEGSFETDRFSLRESLLFAAGIFQALQIFNFPAHVRRSVPGILGFTANARVLK
jgi:hypothetical protein